MRYVTIKGYVMGYKGTDITKRMSNAVVYLFLRVGNQRININDGDHLKSLHKDNPKLFALLVNLTRDVKIKKLFFNKYQRLKQKLQVIFPDKRVNKDGEFSFNVPVLGWGYELLAKVKGSYKLSRLIGIKDMNSNDVIELEIPIQDPLLPEVPPPQARDTIKHTKEDISKLFKLE